MKNNEVFKSELSAFILDLAIFERKLNKICSDAERELNKGSRDDLDVVTLQNLNLQVSPLCFEFMQKLGAFVSGVQSCLPVLWVKHFKKCG